VKPIPVLCALDSHDWREVAIWLDDRDDLPYGLQSLRLAARHVAALELFDSMKPVLRVGVPDA
jgi:hypothetical protein